MAVFTDYYHAMDRENTGLAEVPINEIGFAAHPAKDPLEGLKARIFQGASKVELGFTGANKGNVSQGSTTPESFGTDQRQALKDLAKINKIELSTHATLSLSPLSGLGQRGFSAETQEKSIIEIRRAIDFAADTAGGGAIVFHTGEFDRPVAEVEGGKFEMFPGEAKKAALHLVDKRTGEVIQSLKRDNVIFFPKMVKDENGEEVPEWDPNTQRFKTVPLTFEDIKKQTDEYNKLHPANPITPEEMFYQKHVESEIKQVRGLALNYSSNFEERSRQLNRAKQALEVYERLKKSTPESDWWQLKRQFKESFSDVVPPETEYPWDHLKKVVEQYSRDLESIRQTSSSYEAKAAMLEDQKQNVVAMEKYAIDESTRGIANAAMYAFEVGVKKGKDVVSKPIFVSPENWDPERYGSHPDELKRLILDSRKKMADMLLVQKKVSDRKDAEKIASEHIRATFDVGHANTWRKFFKGSDDDFKSWMVNKTKELVDSGIIGHLHISDNLGYYDEHLTPGQGNVPIKEMLAEIQKSTKGKIDIIVEPAQQDFKALLGGWSHFGSPVYGTLRPGVRWADVEHSYFGRTASPYFVVGEYSPSKEWSLWSEVQLE